MRKISQIINNRRDNTKTWDEKSIFYAFKRIVQEEYGKQGACNLLPQLFRRKTLFIKALSSVWANELWLMKAEILRKINQELNSVEIKEIKISH